MRTTITIDDDLIALAKRRALQRRTSLRQVLEDALRAALLGEERRSRRPFKLVTFRGDGPRAGVDLDRPSALLAAEDVERYGERGARRR